MISAATQKLLDWFQLYRITPTEYAQNLANKPKARAHGAFASQLDELVAYEAVYGYFPIV